MNRSRGAAGAWRRGRLLARLAMMVPLGMLGAFALAGTAAAALPSNCSQSGGTVTCSYGYTGTEQQFAVPAGVSSVHVTATGAPGAAAGYTGGGGGLGAVVGTDVPVTGGSTLYVEVGGPGGLYCLGGFGGNGFNGGGAGYDDGYGCAGGSSVGVSGGGGGASDVRTTSCGSPCNPLAPSSLASRLLVAAGGGGGGACDSVDDPDCTVDVGGAGGNAAHPGNGDSLGLTGGGGAGSQTAAGAAGSQYPFDFDRPFPHPSDLGLGGDGQPSFGGGGGGGYYGGGGGGSVYGGGPDLSVYVGGGGGGGSNLVPSGGTAGTADSTANPGVTISYTVTASTSTVVSSSQNPSVLGQPATFTATVTNTSGSSASTPTGSVQFVIDGVNSGNTVALSGSGSSATASLTVSSLPVGSHTVTASYTNTDGNFLNSSSQTLSQQVIYAWNGFFSPISNTQVNVAQAGQSIPVQFSLGGNQGLSIFATGYPATVGESCANWSQLPDNTISSTDTAGGSSLQYDSTSNTYTYVLKTAKSWSGTCRQLQVKLIDGTTHTADFQFK